MWSRPVGQASWADLVWVEMWKHKEGQHITSSSSVDLDIEWGCSFTADACRQFHHGACFVAPWGVDVIYHYLFRMGVSCTSTVDCISEQLITWGCFLSADLYYVTSLPLLPALMMGDLHSSIRFGGMFACQWPLLEEPLQVAFLAGQLSWLGECEWVQLAHCGVLFCGLLFWGWQPWQRAWMALPAHIALQIQQCNMCNWSPVGWIPFCCNSPWGAPASAWCQHRRLPKWACIGLQTWWQHHYHCLSVHGRQVSISCLQVHWQIHQMSSWHPPVHRHRLMERSHHLGCSRCNQGISLDCICALHLTGPSSP